MNIASLLATTARGQGNDTAVFLSERPLWTYRELARHASTLAHGLQGRLGVAPGDRIVLWSGNSPEYIEVMFAAWFAGAVIVPVNIALYPKEVASIAADCGASLCFAAPEKTSALQDEISSPGSRILPIDAATLNDLRGEEHGFLNVPPTDTAWIFYTSGTTGRPKGAMLSHLNLLAMAFAYLADADFLSPRDSFLHLAPQSHAGGLVMLAHIMKGTKRHSRSDRVRSGRSLPSDADVRFGYQLHVAHHARAIHRDTGARR